MKRPAKLSRLVPVIIVAVVLWAPLYPVLAEDSSPSATDHRPLLRTDLRLGQLTANQTDISQRIQQFRDRIASREALLKGRLDKFKDQTLATIAGRVSGNLNSINKNRTDEMIKHLDTLSTILGKVSQRATSTASASASVQSSIASASAAITTARNTVNAQSQVDYTISATSETGIKGEVQADRNKLLKDLNAARTAVLDARQAVINAIKAVGGGSNNG